MQSALNNRSQWYILIGIAAALVAVAAWLVISSIIGASRNVGSELPQTRNYTLYVRATHLTMPDGEVVWAYGFTDDPSGEAKIPGPTLRANEGDTVNVRLVNDNDPTKTELAPLGDGHTIHLHGIDADTANDGDPMTAPDTQAVRPGDTYTYTFTAKQAGTYWYHCHQEIIEHQQMGMYGALIIGPRGGGNFAYTGGPAYDKEYTFVLSDMDSHAHAAVDTVLHTGGSDPHWATMKANYFLINGKAAPATMSDAADMIQAQVGQHILVRMINAGSEVYPMHLHGFHFAVIASDGYPLKQSYMKDTILIAPGERYDIMITPDKPGEYSLHSHNNLQITNNGESDGGMMTMLTVADKDGNVPQHPARIKSKAELAEQLAALTPFLDALTTAATKGDWAEAQRQYGYLSSRWDSVEKDVRSYSKDAYKAVETKLFALGDLLKLDTPSADAIRAAAATLAEEVAKVTK